MKNKGKIKLFITAIVVASMLAHFLFGSVAASTQNENTEEVHTVEYGAKLIKDITQESNILLVGHYAFDLNNPENNYDVDNFATAQASAVADDGTYKSYYKLGEKWYDLSLAEEHGFTEDAEVKVDDINGGIYYFWNMQGEAVTVVDRSALKAKIAEARDLLDYQETEDPEDIWADLIAAKEAAVEVAANDDASQQDIDDAVKALDSAIEALNGNTNIALASGKHGIDWYLTRWGDLHWMGGQLKAANYPWKKDGLGDKVQRIVIDGKVQLPATSVGVFAGFKNLKRIENADLLDTSNVTNMSQLFSKASSLEYIDVSKWDTSNVTNMSQVFIDASALKYVDVSGWDTSNVTNMSDMFFDASSIDNLEISGWDTSKVTDMHYMFYGASSLSSLNINSWDTSKVTDMRFMFSGASSLTSLDLSDWDTKNVTTMASMFKGMKALTTLNLFSDTSGVESMSEMFSGDVALKSLDVSGWNTSKVKSMNSMFYNASSLTALDLSNWDTTNVTTMISMFHGARSLATLTGTSSWNTSNVTSMAYLFQDTSALTELDLSGWSASSVTNIGNMFVGASNLKTLNLSGWELPSTDNYGNFYKALFTHLKGFKYLETLDLSGWKVTEDLTGQLTQFKSPHAIVLDATTDSE